MPSRFRRRVLPLHLPARGTLAAAAACSILLNVAGPKAARGGADCRDYADYSRWVASLPVTGAVQCIGVEGDLGCLGEVLFEAGRLLTVDLRDLSAPVVLGGLETWETGGIPLAVIVSGGFAYLLASTWGPADLVVIDLADSADPVVAGRLRLPGTGEDLAVAGGYAYVCDGYRELLVAVDVADPRAPRLAGEVAVSGGSHSIAVAGGFAYVADATSSIHVLDLAAPESPAEIAKLVRPTAVHDLDAAPGGLLYLVRDQAFEVIDVSQPTFPTLLGSLGISAHVYRVTADGARALAGDYDRGLLAIDVSDPSSPALAAELGPPGSWDIAVTRGHALVAGGWDGLQFYDLAGLTSPPRLAHVETLGPALGVVLAAEAVNPEVGDLAYVAATSHLEIVDLGELARPERLSALETPGDAMDVAVAGNHAYVADGAAGLAVIDVADPRAPRVVSSLDTPGFATAVAVSDGHAFIADRQEGLQVFDVANPGSPVLIGGFDPGGFEAEVVDVAVSGDYAYLAASRSGVLVLGVWVPSHPQFVTGRPTPGWAMGVQLAGDCLIVSDFTSGVTAFDVSAPHAPVLLATVDTPGDARAAAVRGDAAYVAGRGGGLGVIRFRAPGSLSLIGAGFLPGDAHDVAVPGAARTMSSAFAEGAFVVVARGPDGLDVVPAQCELGPVPVVALDLSGSSGSLGIELVWSAGSPGSAGPGSAAHWAGFELLRADAPHGLPGADAYRVLHGGMLRADRPWRYLDRQVVAGRAYAYRVRAFDRRGVVGASGDLRMLAGEPWAAGSPPAASLESTSPNPAAGDVTFTILAPGPGPIEIRLYDAAGRCVRRLAMRAPATGTHRMTWDGRADDGSPVASGVYLARVMGAGTGAGARVVVVR